MWGQINNPTCGPTRVRETLDVETILAYRLGPFCYDNKILGARFLIKEGGLT